MQLRIFSVAAFSACLAFMLLLTACSPNDYTFSMAKDWRQDKKLQKYYLQLTLEEQELFTAYTERIEQGGPAEINASGMISISEAIRQQAQWQSDMKNNALTPSATQRDESAYTNLFKEMRNVVTPSVNSFKYSKDNSLENWELDTSFKNNGSLKITGIEGTFVVSDDQGVELKRADVQSEVAIEPGAMMEKVWRLGYNSKDAGDQLLKKADVTKLAFSWYPSTYRFADGTKLTLVR
jgi:hypothetical protein